MRIGLKARKVNDREFGRVGRGFTAVADEHRARKQRMPGQLADHSNRQPVIRIGTHESILHKQLATLGVGHHSLFQRVELVLREVFVYVAPENFVLTAGFAHDRFVFRSAARVFTCVDEYATMI